MGSLLQSLEQKQSLTLQLTQGMRLSLKMLQMNVFELESYLKEEFEKNPIIEIELNYGIKYDSRLEDNIASKPSLFQEIFMQLQSKESQSLINAIECILMNCNANGYLQKKESDIAKVLGFSLKDVKVAREKLMNCIPYGIGSLDLKECLLCQANRLARKEELLIPIIKHDLEDVARNHFNKLSRKYQVKEEEIMQVVSQIKSLNPKPAIEFEMDKPLFIKPDIYVFCEDHQIRFHSIRYFNIIQHEYNKAEFNKQEREFLKEKKLEAKMLEIALKKREETLYRIMQNLVETQKSFLLKENNYKEVLLIKDIAQKLDLHETTISRAIKEKYFEWEGQMYSFGYLLNKEVNGYSVDACHDEIKEIIAHEVESISDYKISKLLAEKGIVCSRRTVAKYREDLFIPSSSIRKRNKM